LNNFSNQPNIAQLINTQHVQHQTSLIYNDLDNVEHNASLIQQLLTANSLTISIHNTRNISDTTKYSQLLEILTMHKVDFCGITETGHVKGQSYKLSIHPDYTAFWSTVINRYAGVGLVLHRK